MTALDPDASVREKLVEIASSSGEDRRARRSIRREMAALVVASTGLLLFSLGLFWFNRAAIPANVLDSILLGAISRLQHGHNGYGRPCRGLRDGNCRGLSLGSAAALCAALVLGRRRNGPLLVL